MCSRIRSQVIRYFSWLTPWNRLKRFFFPAEMKGIFCNGEAAAAHLPKGRGRSRLQHHSLCTSALPLCRRCVDLLSDVVTWRAASIWSGPQLAGCRAYKEPHLYPSTSSCHWEEFKGSWHKHEGPWKSHSCVVWILGHLSFARGISPCVINPAPAIPLQHLKMFCRGWRLQVYERESEKEAVASPVCPRKEYLGALFLSVQTPSALFAPRQHFLWNQTTGSCPKFYQMITPWKPKCDCMSWASSRRFCETEGSSWWHNSNYSSFFPLLK